MSDLFNAFPIAVHAWLDEPDPHPDIQAAFDTIGEDIAIEEGSRIKRPIPCIEIGSGDQFERADRDDLEIWIVRARFHVWTRESSQEQVRTLAGAVQTAMNITQPNGSHTAFDVPGWRIVYGECIDVRFLPDPDDGIQHAVLEFEFRMNAV